MRKWLQFSWFCIVLFLPQISLAYSSVTVPIEEPVYRQIDKLVAHGLIKDRLLGQRPYVRAEIARLIAEAMENYPAFEAKHANAAGDSSKAYVDRILRELKDDYRDELVQRGALPGEIPRVQCRPIEQLRVDFLYLNQDPALFPPNNGLGSIRAETHSLVEQQGGRHFQKGVTMPFETMHWLRLGKYFSVQAEPRFQMQGVQGSLSAETGVFAQRLNGRFTYNKLDIEIGRDSLNWGPSTYGGLSYSNNARPLDFVKLSSVSPFRYPFVFKKIGINEWSLVVANLGPEQRFQNPWLVTFKNSTRGSPYLEIGFTNTLISGGEGAPHLGFGNGFVALFGAGSSQVKDASVFNLGLEAIGTIPKFRGMELYLEMNFADLTVNASEFFVDDFSALVGLYLPRLNDSGTLDLRVEYRRLAPRYARDAVFTDGVTENGFLIGDPLGPDSYGVSADINYDCTADTLLGAGLRFAQRNASFFGSGAPPAVDAPKETRFRVQATVQHRFNPHVTGRLGFGIEQVHNFNFARNDDQTQWMGMGGFTYYFRPHLSVGRSR